MKPRTSPRPPAPSRRQLLGAAAAAPLTGLPTVLVRRAKGPAMVGSSNGFPGMELAYPRLVGGAHPLDAAIDVVKVVEADPEDTSVGLGGLPNERGEVALDAACMDGTTHNSGAVACIENILHPSEVARLVMERTDHCLLVGRGAYEFARMYGHPHTELLTESSRRAWVRWRETMSERDDRLPPPPPRDGDAKHGALPSRFERHGTIHCSAMGTDGAVACTTTTSGLAWKIPGRVGDSPIVGAGLYCDQEAGSAGSTGRGEAAILSNGSFAIVELMRQGASPLDAGMEVLRRIVRQTARMGAWQPSLVREDGTPAFGVNFYVLGLDGETAGVTLRQRTHDPLLYAAANPDDGPQKLQLEPLLT